MGGNGDCLEAASTEDGIVVRDSKNRTGPTLNYSFGVWRTFVGEARLGNFDCLSKGLHPSAVKVQE
jgi:hypothetical protein